MRLVKRWRVTIFKKQYYFLWWPDELLQCNLSKYSCRITTTWTGDKLENFFPLNVLGVLSWTGQANNALFRDIAVVQKSPRPWLPSHHLLLLFTHKFPKHSNWISCRILTSRVHIRDISQAMMMDQSCGPFVLLVTEGFFFLSLVVQLFDL